MRKSILVVGAGGGLGALIVNIAGSLMLGAPFLGMIASRGMLMPKF